MGTVMGTVNWYRWQDKQRAPAPGERREGEPTSKEWTMASIDERHAALALSRALRELDKAQAQIDDGDWWDGPPWAMEVERDSAVDRVMAAVRAVNFLAAEPRTGQEAQS